MADKQEYITIDGMDYKLDDLSQEARKQIINVKFTDEEIDRLKSLLAIAQTARATYGQALTDALPKPAKKKK